MNTSSPTAVDVFRGTEGPRDAEIAIVGESWGSEEADAGRPFVGPAGGVLNGMLEEAGIRRDRCFITNVVSARPYANDMQTWFEVGDATLAGLRPSPIVVDGVKTLYAQLDAVRPKVVLAFGNYALWALTRHAGSVADGPRPRTPSGILDWRGSQVYRVESGLDRGAEIGSGHDTSYPVLPLAHPAAILRDWALRVPTVHDLRSRVPLGLGGKWSATDRDPPLKLECLFEQSRAWAVLAGLLTQADLAAAAGRTLKLVCDVETYKAHLLTCIGIATSDVTAYSLPLVALTGDRTHPLKSYWKPDTEALFVTLLCKLFQHPAVVWIGQNFGYDRAFLWEWFRVELKVFWDSMVAQHLLFPGTQKDLGYLASLYCKHYRFWKRDARDWLEDDDELGLEQHCLYNAEDCARNFEIAVEQKRALYEIEAAYETTPEAKRAALGRRLALWESDELPAIEFAWSMYKRGTRTSQKERARLAMQLIEQRAALADWLQGVAPQALLTAEGATPKTGTPWQNSHKQCAILFYGVLGLTVQRQRKTGAVSTDDESLNTLKELHPRLTVFLDALLEYRSLGVLFSTFVEAKLDPDGRFRSSFNPAGTATYRFSSSKTPFKRGGNFQNIPAGADE